MPLLEIKDFNVLIGKKPFFDLPVKIKQEAYKKLTEMSRNGDYTAGNLSDFSYHPNYYKFIGIDLSWQTYTSIPEQSNFVGKLEKYHDAAMLFIAEKQQKTILNFSLDELIVS